MGRSWIAWCLIGWSCGLLGCRANAADEEGFAPIFDGKTLNGWMGAKYEVEDGKLVCPEKGGGTILTEKQYAHFVLRFAVKFGPGANNGVGIRTPAQGDPAYVGMEVQILDDSSPQYAKLRPTQYHGSICDVFAAKRGALKAPGEWNDEEILVDGRHVKVTLNGQVIVDANLDDVKDPEVLKKHPGLLRQMGHIGFMGHGARVEFKDIRVKELDGPLNVAPPGFEAAFNGKDLTGWKALVGDPRSRAKMTPEQLAAAQTKADAELPKHWTVQDGILTYDGKNNSLCTAKDYGDFEMWVDWKIHKGGDSGIYLRGSPQVQIWQHPVGSGGLFNNQKNPSKPLRVADRPVEQWNTFFIRMVGEKVWVWLNGWLVVDNTTMENYWERSKPIYPTGQIELQHHTSPLWFRNVYLKELPRP